MRIGELRHRVTVQEKVETPDAMGGASTSWQDLATVWAQVKTSDRQEEWREGQMTPGMTYTVVIRYRANVDTSMRVVYDGRALNILAASDPSGRKRMLKLTCQEVAR